MKINKYILTSLFPVLLIPFINQGCSSGQPGKKAIANEDSLINLMIGIQLTEARLTQERGKGINTDQLARKRYDSLFAYYKTSKKEYEDQLKKLTSNPDEYISVYDSVIVRLERMKQEKPDEGTNK